MGSILDTQGHFTKSISIRHKCKQNNDNNLMKQCTREKSRSF